MLCQSGARGGEQIELDQHVAVQDEEQRRRQLEERLKVDAGAEQRQLDVGADEELAVGHRARGDDDVTVHDA
jgi:hypothetical protein